MARVRFVRCPQCDSDHVHVDRTRGIVEQLLGLFGYYAFRCGECYTRFLHSPLGLSKLFYAKCPRCYRMDLSTWDPSYYRASAWSEFKVWLGAHRWRCEACRCNFVSWRVRRQKYIRPGVREDGV